MWHAVDRGRTARPRSGLRRASGLERQKKPDSGHLGLDQAGRTRVATRKTQRAPAPDGVRVMGSDRGELYIEEEA